VSGALPGCPLTPSSSKGYVLFVSVVPAPMLVTQTSCEEVRENISDSILGAITIKVVNTRLLASLRSSVCHSVRPSVRT
jgi:hypothetical protein